MSFFKIQYGEHLYIPFYVKIQNNFKSAIDRIKEFTKGSEFEEADNILLEIKLGLLETYFLKYMQCNESLISDDCQEDNSKNIEDLYVEIKTKIKRKLLCISENANVQTSVTAVPISTAQQEDNKTSHNTNLNGKEVTEDLYNNIVHAPYYPAGKVSRNISSSGHGDIIKSVVLKLAQEGNKNLLSYVYSLWSGGDKDIVEKYMPETFKMIFSETWVTLIQKEFGLALKMDANVDRDGDRIIWGDSRDKTSHRVNWKLMPFWDNNRVYFHIKNTEHEMLMKLEINPDDIGDRGAFGSNDRGTDRHVWILEPVVINDEVLFYIFNREYNQGLKLQMSTDSMGDRKLWGHNGNVYNDPAHYAWYIDRSWCQNIND